jgi:hypothetical protein
MPKLTLQVDEENLRKARKIAIDRNTTVTEMIREFLATVVDRGGLEKEQALRRLRATFAKHERDMGPRAWTRESLYKREGIPRRMHPCWRLSGAGCRKVISEDLSDGQEYNGVLVENPFRVP